MVSWAEQRRTEYWQQCPYGCEETRLIGASLTPWAGHAAECPRYPIAAARGDAPGGLAAFADRLVAQGEAIAAEIRDTPLEPWAFPPAADSDALSATRWS